MVLITIEMKHVEASWGVSNILFVDWMIISLASTL